ncbi:DUF1489 family protein [Aurantimonas sp. MSK8Z-1]|uniref:DUF1489 family protein n=1 Tax=Mangrovibrevibacter kandeliae TaxID=2968473 RepID=UPI0021187480|nr:DUF1489 family protein [Aurantimonas sp. MSK8Z-1]MCW4114711.1 DUF1489 family protein [Aurantimonas sp. MSK8Z-1]
MALHLIKLCVGADRTEDLEGWIDARRHAAAAERRPFEQLHQTRMFPKRSGEILDGGSLFWVIRGQVRARQPILDLRQVVDAEGISRCHIVLQPALVLTRPQPRRAFQGWRYLDAADAPDDLASGDDTDELPADLRYELAVLGLM